MLLRVDLKYWYSTTKLMAGYFGRSYDDIMLLALFYIVSAIPIGYGILHINIIIFETPYTKFNIFNLIHHSSHIYII